MQDSEKQDERFLLIDFDHTFLSSTLREEALLFGVNQYKKLVYEVSVKFKKFKEDFSEEQSLDELSGGENALLAVIFYTSLAEHKNKSVQFLFSNILESLSEKNRELLKEILIDHQKNGQQFKILVENQIKSLYE